MTRKTGPAITGRPGLGLCSLGRKVSDLGRRDDTKSNISIK
jgi:hypothetical protein